MGLVWAPEPVRKFVLDRIEGCGPPLVRGKAYPAATSVYGETWISLREYDELPLGPLLDLVRTKFREFELSHLREIRNLVGPRLKSS